MALNFPAAPTLNQLYPSPPTTGVPVWRWDGSEWVPNSGNGAVIFSQFEYTASAAQTTFTGADANSATLAYTVGFIEVFVNGSKVNKGDFTATNGTSVVLGSACSANDLITILAFSVNSVANTLAPGNNLSDLGNIAQALANLGVRFGQCTFGKSGSNVVLLPKGGNLLTVNGVACTIPAAGVSLAPTGLTAGNTYLVYATATAGVVTGLEASATGHSTSSTAGNIGVEIKTGDDTRTLVGMVSPIAGPAFSDITTVSWFNRGSKTSSVTEASRGTGTGLTVTFVSWSDEVVQILCPAHGGANAAVSASNQLQIDGSNVGIAVNGDNASGVISNINLTNTHSASVSEGKHTSGPVFGGAGGTFGYMHEVTIRG